MLFKVPCTLAKQTEIVKFQTENRCDEQTFLFVYKACVFYLTTVICHFPLCSSSAQVNRKRADRKCLPEGVRQNTEPI